jgi:hypothetical protein
MAAIADNVIGWAEPHCIRSQRLHFSDILRPWGFWGPLGEGGRREGWGQHSPVAKN